MVIVITIVNMIGVFVSCRNLVAVITLETVAQSESAAVIFIVISIITINIYIYIIIIIIIIMIHVTCFIVFIIVVIVIYIFIIFFVIVDVMIVSKDGGISEGFLWKVKFGGVVDVVAPEQQQLL